MPLEKGDVVAERPRSFSDRMRDIEEELKHRERNRRKLEKKLEQKRREEPSFYQMRGKNMGQNLKKQQLARDIVKIEDELAKEKQAVEELTQRLKDIEEQQLVEKPQSEGAEKERMEQAAAAASEKAAVATAAA